MYKKDLIVKVASSLAIPKRDTAIILDVMISEMSKALKGKEDVTLTGFGTLQLREKNQRLIKVPKSEKHITVPQKRTVSFKASKVLKEYLNHK